jgi:AraC-like DNA-binding protein
VPGLLKHSHSQIFEIFLLDRGEVEWWTENQSFHVRAGHVYINRPGEAHGSSGHSMKPCSYFWLQLDARPQEFLPTLPREEAEAILSAFESLSQRYFAVSGEVKTCFEGLFQEARQPETFSSVMARAHLHRLLVTVLRDAGRQPSIASTSPLLEGTQRLIAAYPDAVSPAFLAQEMGLSASHFHERFLVETGFTPHTYIVRQRIEAAKQLLGEGELSISTIAFRVGFSSSQHFATVFKKVEGISPSQFLKRSSS